MQGQRAQKQEMVNIQQTNHHYQLSLLIRVLLASLCDQDEQTPLLEQR